MIPPQVAPAANHQEHNMSTVAIPSSATRAPRTSQLTLAIALSAVVVIALAALILAPLASHHTGAAAPKPAGATNYLGQYPGTGVPRRPHAAQTPPPKNCAYVRPDHRCN
jgi:hypothetical protein